VIEHDDRPRRALPLRVLPDGRGEGEESLEHAGDGATWSSVPGRSKSSWVLSVALTDSMRWRMGLLTGTQQRRLCLEEVSGHLGGHDNSGHRIAAEFDMRILAAHLSCPT
jgi:hypothetical protein